MTPNTLVAPELEEAIEERKDAEHLLPRNGNGGSQSTLPVSSDAELKKLNEEELKAAIKSAWKKCERLAKKDMGPLLYWLRVRLRAQGSRNDIIDKDRGFSAWVQENLDISQSTANRWADQYAVESGLKEPKPTSSQMTRSDDDDFYGGILDEHKGEQQIAFNHWVKTAVHAQYQKALIKIQEQLGLENKKDALVEGVLYAAKNISARASKRSHPSAHAGRNRGRRGVATGLVKRGTGRHQ